MPRVSIGAFARHILKRPLYWYQEEIGNAILDSIIHGNGHTFTCMLARQMGKNQLSAILEAYLLYMFAYDGGNIIKAAPTYKPQVINSMLRLSQMLESEHTLNRVWRSHGYIIGLAPDPSLTEAKTGARCMFFSAGPESNIVGATASLLLEVDEAQDVAQEKYDVELKPMASTTNATSILFGTAWSDDTLLARQREHNLQLEEQDGIKRHFEFDWRHLAAINTKYKKFVEGEIERLGSEHLSIRTQYMLKTISGAGYLLNDLQRYLLHGSHSWLAEPAEDEEGYFVAGLDVGGEERARPGDEVKGISKRDSTVLTIGRVRYNEFDLPAIEIVHHEWWTGMKYLDQYAATAELMERWNIRKLVIDKTGLGDGLSSLLLERFGDERIAPYQFTRPSKSRLTFQFLGMINSGRLKIYESEDAPSPIFEECWKQLSLARYQVPSEGLMNMYCDMKDNTHDDFLMSIALCAEAVREFYQPVQESSIVQPRKYYDQESRF
jgi:hypothetical protein